MELGAIATWMGQSWLGEAARDVFWLFPTAEIVHFFGLCLLMGALLLIDLRVLGFARSVSIKKVIAFTPVAIVGLVLNIVSGIVFLCAYPENYWPSAYFQLKMLAVVVGGLNALWFKWVEAPRIELLADDGDAGACAKLVAAISLLTWIVVIVLGRFLPYVTLSSS
jgi:hypothetical protein